jgi:putative hemolysin
MRNLVAFLVAATSLTVLAIPNPAAIFCINNGGMIETRQDSGGNQMGICKFNVGGVESECSDWGFLRGECYPGQCAVWSAETNSCEKSLPL